MKFFKASTRLKPLLLQGEIETKTMNVDAHQSLLAIKKVTVEAEVRGLGDIYEAQVTVDADVVLECAYTLEPIDYHLHFRDVITFSDVETEDVLIEWEYDEFLRELEYSGLRYDWNVLLEHYSIPEIAIKTELDIVAIEKMAKELK